MNFCVPIIIFYPKEFWDDFVKIMEKVEEVWFILHFEPDMYEYIGSFILNEKKGK